MYMKTFKFAMIIIIVAATHIIRIKFNYFSINSYLLNLQILPS